MPAVEGTGDSAARLGLQGAPWANCGPDPFPAAWVRFWNDLVILRDMLGSFPQICFVTDPYWPSKDRPLRVARLARVPTP
jgi:hypothetical protein